MQAGKARACSVPGGGGRGPPAAGRAGRSGTGRSGAACRRPSRWRAARHGALLRDGCSRAVPVRAEAEMCGVQNPTSLLEELPPGEHSEKKWGSAVRGLIFYLLI